MSCRTETYLGKREEDKSLFYSYLQVTDRRRLVSHVSRILNNSAEDFWDFLAGSIAYGLFRQLGILPGNYRIFNGKRFDEKYQMVLRETPLELPKLKAFENRLFLGSLNAKRDMGN